MKTLRLIGMALVAIVLRGCVSFDTPSSLFMPFGQEEALASPYNAPNFREKPLSKFL